MKLLVSLLKQRSKQQRTRFPILSESNYQTVETFFRWCSMRVGYFVNIALKIDYFSILGRQPLLSKLVKSIAANPLYLLYKMYNPPLELVSLCQCPSSLLCSLYYHCHCCPRYMSSIPNPQQLYKKKYQNALIICLNTTIISHFYLLFEWLNRIGDITLIDHNV